MTCLSVVLFFFFKQKTAYEMRISDWSSDVCSSDLRDSYSYHRDKMYANLAVSMGGRVAEEIIFGYDKVSSGASGDIQYATGLARDMVTKWGMSDKVGPVEYSQPEGESFLGYSSSQPVRRSEEHTSELQSLMRISYAVFCLKKTHQLHYD